MRSRSNLFPVGEILELPLGRGEVGVVFLPTRLSHRMNQHSVAVSNGCHDAGRDIVLHIEDRGGLQAPIISLGPELSPCLGIYQLSAHPNAGAALANASPQHIARAEFVTQNLLISGLTF